MKDMKKMLEMLSDETREGGDMNDERTQAKMEVLRELMQMAADQEGSGLAEGLNKITVAAPDEEGLMEGLDKAEEVVEDMPEMMEGMEDSMDEEEDEEDEEDM